MRNFTCVQDIGNLKTALAEAFEIKKDRFKYVELGRNKTLMMIFFNSSLRTRLSTQKAALNLGMNVIVLDINQGAWKLETERGVIMDGDKPEHLLEAIPVMGCYATSLAYAPSPASKTRSTIITRLSSTSSSNTQADPYSRWKLLPAIRYRVSPTSSPSKNTRRRTVRKWS